MRSLRPLAISFAFLLPIPTVLVQPADKPPGGTRVKETPKAVSGGSWITGVVTAVDADSMTVVGKPNVRELPSEHRFLPIDVLRNGKVAEGVKGRFAYCWTDVKVGDKVQVQLKLDDVDKERYCVRINIERRPGGTLPESQDPKGDDDFPQRRLVNDVENGEDVSDEDIMKAFPAVPPSKDGTGLPFPGTPGGLPPDLKKKLDETRAKKKEQELKATPPKKDDKK